MRNAFLSLAAISVCLTACSHESPQETFPANSLTVSGPFFSFAGDTVPQVMMPGFISTQNQEVNGAFSPDGKEFVYCVTFPGMGSRLVSTTLLADNTWSEPEITHFSGPYGGVDPLYSPDGKRLYFSSFRPLDSLRVEPKDADIWFVERTAEGWGAPQHLGLPVNTGTNQLYNSVTNNGNIYFNSRNNETGTYKIHVAIKTAEGYQVEELGGQLNVEGLWDPFVSPEEDYLIFIYRSDNGLGGTDLYISYKGEAGWGEPILLPEPINSPYDEKMPSVTKGNQLLIFTSNRMQQSWIDHPKNKLREINSKIGSTDNGMENIYWVNADFIEKLRPTPKQTPLEARAE